MSLTKKFISIFRKNNRAVQTDTKVSDVDDARAASLKDDFYSKALSWTDHSDDEETNCLIESAIKYFMPEIGQEQYVPSALSVEESSRLVLHGIVLGDMAGCPYEGVSVEIRTGYYKPSDYKTIPFFIEGTSHFTDDSVMSAAIYKAALDIRQNDITKSPDAVSIYAESMKRFAKKFPSAGYGSAFSEWALGPEPEFYKSFGNGSAMRSGVIGALFSDCTIEEVIRQAVLSALPTHSHPEGIKAAVVASIAVYMGLHNISKEKVIAYMTRLYLDNEYDPRTVRPDSPMHLLTSRKVYTISVKSQVTMPEVIVNLRNCDSYESCIRNAFRYPCDADTVDAISGGIAAAVYGNTDVKGINTEETADKALAQIFGAVKDSQ